LFTRPELNRANIGASRERPHWKYVCGEPQPSTNRASFSAVYQYEVQFACCKHTFTHRENHHHYYCQHYFGQRGLNEGQTEQDKLDLLVCLPAYDRPFLLNIRPPQCMKVIFFDKKHKMAATS